MVTFQDKVAVLKRLETDCYSLCLYLLNIEKAAVVAAEQTLLDLFDDSDFWRVNDAAKRSLLLRRASFYCLEQQTLTDHETEYSAIQ